MRSEIVVKTGPLFDFLFGIVEAEEELLVEKPVLAKMWVLRRILMPMGVVDAMEFLIEKLRPNRTNSEFFNSMNT